MSRTQITLEKELQKQAHRRASEMGVSFAEYVRRLVAPIYPNPKPQTPNPKPQTPNPKPQTPKAEKSFGYLYL